MYVNPYVIHISNKQRIAEETQRWLPSYVDSLDLCNNLKVPVK
jgi:hypothetical protein